MRLCGFEPRLDIPFYRCVLYSSIKCFVKSPIRSNTLFTTYPSDVWVNYIAKAIADARPQGTSQTKRTEKKHATTINGRTYAV